MRNQTTIPRSVPGSAIEVMPEGFTVLATPQPGNVIVADIILVHGLQGHPEGSFAKQLPAGNTSESTSLLDYFRGTSTKGLSNDNINSVFWPRDLLPTVVPNARILTYGYDSKVFNIFGANQNGISQHAQNFLADLQRLRKGELEKCPIIFVAHSLGGIIVKESLRRANTSHDQQLNRIYKTTYAVVFLGCPHRGSPQAKWAKIVARMSQLALMAPNKKVINALAPNNELLELIAEAFAGYLGDIRVHSFREEKGMSGIAGLSDKVVEDYSATIGDDREGREGINADHVGIAKFGGPEDTGFKKISGVIAGYIQDIMKDGGIVAKSEPVVIDREFQLVMLAFALLFSCIAAAKTISRYTGHEEVIVCIFQALTAELFCFELVSWMMNPTQASENRFLPVVRATDPRAAKKIKKVASSAFAQMEASGGSHSKPGINKADSTSDYATGKKILIGILVVSFLIFVIVRSRH